MYKVIFYPNNVSVFIEEGATILEAARKVKVEIEAPCNGATVCGKCKVKLDSSSLKKVQYNNSSHISREEIEHGIVLSCETRVLGDINVFLQAPNKEEDLKILSQGKALDVEIHPYIKKKYYEDRNITEVLAGSDILFYESGDTRNQAFGIVIDIGTTTLVASLINLTNGKELGNTSELNPQAIHGQDVLSRIKIASEKEGRELMHSLIINKINNMIDELLAVTQVNREKIYEIIFSGNTCMLHLAGNVNPYSLGKYPYIPELSGHLHMKAKTLGLTIAQEGVVYFPPIISAYVGADITSGILAAELYKSKGTILFVDIGTNGEMVIARDGRLSATSTAAGPAFEGMNITCGMRAAKGAIEYFNVEENKEVTTKTIGDEEPIGICGSGLLDIVGELVYHKVIDKNGKFSNKIIDNESTVLRERLVDLNGKKVFQLSEKVHLTQKDIRQVQLAKGAVRAGIEFLLKSKEIEAKDVDTVLIAGSFGYHLRAKSLINIGLLPKEFEGKIQFVGNTSKTGGKAILLNNDSRNEIYEVVNQVEVVELSKYKDFDKVFVKHLVF
ncbi:(Fe-S)-binding protein [Clostridium polyendosporum]|uniref:(Fe-S)-binding protein n=1 Tax=Clostridium polyendosporum TaxID=69208 RepID=A0A919VFC6_9CLOT|nr:ASKHA domain-containing protein [Clostridium polyendosporum]GIM30149.1 (Fe-S)-binding protein [Clostridium polyendosporum]